jgi:hypothetical protein
VCAFRFALSFVAAWGVRAGDAAVTRLIDSHPRSRNSRW